MKKLFLILLIVFSQAGFARGHGGGGGHVHVNGYYRHDGTYVQPHMRTSPDGIKTNNFSYQGNVNPYTGKVGTNPDSSPNYGRSGYYGNAGGGYGGGYYQQQPQTQQQIVTRTLNPLDTMPNRKIIPD
jgi:hypothetical protein